MSKIKVVSNEETFIGEVSEGLVKPFGTGGVRITGVSVRDTGKFVKIITPSEPHYAWILNQGERIRFLKEVEKGITELKDSRLKIYYSGLLREFKKDRFYLNTLNKLLKFVSPELTKKIKKIYGGKK